MSESPPTAGQAQPSGAEPSDAAPSQPGAKGAAMSGDQLAKRARALSGALATWGSRVAKSMPTGQEVKQGMSKAGTRAKAWGKGVAENVRTMDITDVQNSVRSGIRRISASSDIPADAEVVAFERSKADWTALTAAYKKAQDAVQRSAQAHAELGAVLKQLAENHDADSSGAEGGDSGDGGGGDGVAADDDDVACNAAFVEMLRGVSAAQLSLEEHANTFAQQMAHDALEPCQMFTGVVAADSTESVRRHRRLSDQYSALRHAIRARAEKEASDANKAHAAAHAAANPPAAARGAAAPPPPAPELPMIATDLQIDDEIISLPEGTSPSAKLRSEVARLLELKPKFESSRQSLAEKMRLTADKSRRDLIAFLTKQTAGEAQYLATCATALEEVAPLTEAAHKTPSAFESRGEA